MNYSCEVSLIIPVYNAEEYLSDCLRSVEEQTFFSNMEVIIIDDGSTDDSLSFCEHFRDGHHNVKLFSQEHSGVAVARNCGLENAAGKYIMFLDADDSLQKNTVEAVYDYFEKVYDLVDVVSYPEKRVEDGKPRPSHFRYTILKETGIYDLNENIYICQSRLNVAVKNTETLARFDTSLPSAEDQAFLSTVLSDKMKMGFINEGAYIYNLHGDSLSFTKSFIYYVAENIHNYYGKMFDSVSVPPYFQSIFLYDLDWKIKKDQLWPYHYDSKRFEDYKDTLVSLLQRCDERVILGHPSLDLFHKIYLLKLRHSSLLTIADKEELKLVCGDNIIFKSSKVTIVVCQLAVIDDSVKIVAHLKSPVFSFTDKPKLYAHLDQNDRIEPELFESTASRYRTKMKTNLFWGFCFECGLDEFSELHFSVEIDNIIYDTDFYFMPQTPICLQKNITTLIGDKRSVTATNNTIISEECPNDKKIRLFNDVRNGLLHTNPGLFEIFKKFDLFRKKKIWLYYDCKNVDVDNGYYQFIHDFEKEDGIVRYYISNNDEIREGLFEEKHRKYIVRFGSQLHKELFINARKVITAYIEKNNVYPFSSSELQLIGNWFFAEYIYLQHGILHASIPWKYTPEAMRIDKVVVSSDFEVDNFISNYNFRDQDLLKTGMPRFDAIKKKKKGKKRILFAPTWRNYLIKPQVDNYWEPTEMIFLSSDYYKNIRAFLSSERLIALLESNDYFMDFKLHPIFYNAYKDFFISDSHRIGLADTQIDMSDYDVLITDYSSISFDFAYLKRTIIYYVPDYDQFRSGMNQYRKLDLEYEDAFGPLFTESEDVITFLEKTVSGQCVPEKEYEEKMSRFFIKKTNRRETLYKQILK